MRTIISDRRREHPVIPGKLKEHTKRIGSSVMKSGPFIGIPFYVRITPLCRAGSGRNHGALPRGLLQNNPSP